MSSRNQYLTKKEREKAPLIYKSLKKAKKMISSGEKDPKKVIQVIKKIVTPLSSKIDYISIVDTENLEKVKAISGRVLIALAVWVGKARLIDNIVAKVNWRLSQKNKTNRK